MAGVDVTVSIVNHESRDTVLASLDVLAADSGRRATIEVLVVDNCSQDGSVAAIEAAHPWVRVIARTDRGGYGANHDLAIEASRGRHVLLLNDDAQVTPGSIDRLVDHLDATPEAGVAAPTIVDAHGAVMPSLWPAATPAEELRTLLRLGRARPAEPGEPIGWAMGCALLVRGDALRRVGGFDAERFFMYSEEIDLCARLARLGLRTDHVAEARVVHDGQASTGDSPARAVEMSRSRRAYQDLHYGPVGRVVGRVAVSLTFLLLALLAVARRQSPVNPWRQAVVAWRDTRWTGLREQAEAFNAR